MYLTAKGKAEPIIPLHWALYRLLPLEAAIAANCSSAIR